MVTINKLSSKIVIANMDDGKKEKITNVSVSNLICKYDQDRFW